MDRRRAAGVLLALAACVAYATAAPTASNHTSLDIYNGAPDGCYYNFQHYGEGDRIMTNEPCLNCTCHNRMLMCYLRVCPFTKPIGQDCTIEKRADQCCPIVTCPDVPVDLLTSTTTSPAEYGATGLGMLEKYGCSIHGKYFPEGSKVPPAPNKPCEHCYCIRNMTTCVMQECTLHVDGCTPIYHKDVCCPVRYSCDHPEDEMPLLDDLSTTVRPTPGFLLTTTTLSPVTQMSQECVYENQIISDGALIKTEKACDHCYCMKGDIVCVVQECGTPMENEGKNCTALAPREGVCCPDTYICEGDEPTTGTYEADYTTEIDKLTTLSPPRRAGSEGSGYRNEPDSISNTELPSFETETEGSGYESATIHPPVITEALPESHKIEPAEEIVSSIAEPHDFNTILTTATKEPDSYDADVTTHKDLQKDTEPQQYIPSTDKSSTAAQDEDIGSGEEEIVTSYEIVSTASTLPAIIASGSTVDGEPHVATTEANKDIETPFKETTTSEPITDKDQTNIDTSTDDSAIRITTETHGHINVDEGIETSTILNEEYHGTEHDSLRTTSVPIAEENVSRTTVSPEQDKTTLHSQYYSTTTSILGFEDEIATESQDVVTDRSEGTDSDFDLHHQITVTASTPLLEEIEKDVADDSYSPDKFKTSTTLLNLPTEEAIYKESLKPDFDDETIASNLPTTVSEFENDIITTDDPLKLQESDLEDSSKSQQNSRTTTSVPVFEDKIMEITPSDTINTSKTQEEQKTDVDESSEPQQNAPTTSAPVYDDEMKKTTPSDFKTQESQDKDVDESSEPQQNAPTTSVPVFEDEIKQFTPLDTKTTSKTQESQETIDESSEPQQKVSTTSGPVFDDETKKITMSDFSNTSKTQESHITDANESSEPQQTAPTTSSPVYDGEKMKTTLSDSRATSKTQDDQESDVDESSEPQQNAPTTVATVYDDQTKEITPADSMTTSKIQKGQETDADESSEPQENAPTTTAPVFEDEIKETTLSNTINTSKTQEDQKTDVDKSSEPQQNAPTTSAPVYDDETKKTTQSDTITTSKAEKGQEIDVDESSEPQQYATSTSAPVFESEIKITTSTDSIAPSYTQDDLETNVDESSESQQNALTTSASVYDDESEKTTQSDLMITSKIQENQETGVVESLEPQQYTPTTSAPMFDDKTMKTTPADSMTTFKTQESQETEVKGDSETQEYTPVFEDETKKTTPHDSLTTPKTQEPDVEKSSVPQQFVPTTTFADEIINTSSEATFEPNAITTAEPDKGLNTIPSGTLEDETTESPGIEKYTDSIEMVHTESSTELDNTFNEADTYKPVTSKPDTSVSLEDQFTLTTESIVEKKDDKTIATENYDVMEQTTVPAEIYKEELSTLIYDLLSSTKLPASVYQESSTSSVPLNTENVKQTTDSQKPIATSSYESSSSATALEDVIPEKHEDTTSYPSYATVPSSTTADLEENEIINEPRIPGEGDCLLNGVTFRNESSVPSINKCQSGCRCSSSIIKCDPIICSPPPEYMDNCQPTYDSLDSCCPTYVCDHKTETMPPQSHSQMSGTEAPVESPIKCDGAECVISEDKNQSEETPELCKSGSCTTQDETSSHPLNIPEQIEVDRHEDCTGNKCTSSDPTDQLCSKESGCQAVPVIPCEGTECEITSDTIASQKPPCVGDHCDIPVKDCSAGKCDLDDGQDKHDIEKECTEKSCKRKEDSELEQEIPKKCSGSECPLTDSLSDIDLTTTDKIDIAAEKIEKSSVSPSIETDLSTRLEEDTTEEPGEYVTVQADILSQPLSTPRYPDIATAVPHMDSEREEISTVYESATSENKDINEIPVVHVPDSTHVLDSEIMTEAPINLPHVTDKLEDDVTTKTETTESPSLSFDKESTTEKAEEISTQPPKTYTTDEKEVTKLPQEIYDQEKTTFISNEIETEPDTLNVTEQLATQLPEKDIPKDTATSIFDEMITEPPKKLESDDSHDEKVQEVTKSPLDDEITAKTAIYSVMEEVTKLPQTDDDEKEPMITVNDNIGSTTLKPYDSDAQETTKTPEESQSEKTTAMDEFVSDVKETSKSPEEISSDELIKHDLEKTSTETSVYLENEVTHPPERTGELTTTSIEEDINTGKIESSDLDAQEVTQPFEDTMKLNEVTTSKIIDESSTEKLKPHVTELQKVTSPSEQTESEDATKNTLVTESSLVIETDEQKATKSTGAIEFTTLKVIAETDIYPSKHDDKLHEITVPQQETETDRTVSDVEDETHTESSESEQLSTTKSTDDSEESMEKFTIKPYEEPITQSSAPDIEPLSDITTTKASEDEHKLSSESHFLEKNTTSQHGTAPELTTQSILDSVSTESEKTGYTEISTRIEPSQPTESIIESASETTDEAILTSSESPIHKEDEITTLSDLDILTESPIDLATKPIYEETSSDKPSNDRETTDTTMETVTDSLKDQNTEEPDEGQKATEEDVKFNEITQKPTSGYDGGKVQEDDKTEIPVILEAENDSLSEVTTSKSSDTINALYNVDLKTEQPETVNYTKEQLDKTTTEVYSIEKTTVEPSKIDALETVTPFDDELITKATSGDADKLLENETEVEREPVTTQSQYINTQPTKTDEETYTKIPIHSFSDSDAPNENDDKELTTSAVKISDPTTELNTFSHITTEPSDLQQDTSKPDETPQVSAETEVTELNIVESSTSRDEEEDKETQTMIPDVSTVQESSTKEPLPTDMHKLSTVSSQETYTEASIENVTTVEPVITNTEIINEPVTDPILTVTKSTEIKTPEQETIELSQPTATESTEHVTRTHDQEDGESVASTDSSPTSPTVIKLTEAPEAFETSSELSEMITSQTDIETSTPTREFAEATTSGQIEDEKISPIESTEIPVTVSDQQTVEVGTESKPGIIDTETKKQEPATQLMEDELMPSKTSRPEVSSTTLSTAVESANSTPSPDEESSTASDQTLPLTSIEPQITDGAQLATTVVSEQDKDTLIPEIEVQSEKVTTPSEAPSQPEPYPVTSAPVEEKITTAKAEELTTVSPVFDKFTKPSHTVTETTATEQHRPIPAEEQPIDDILTPDEEPSIPPSGASGYGTDPDYMEEDQTFGPGTCRYGGKVYVSAQQIPRDDPCDFCFCFRSDIICLQQSCPPPIHGCHEEPISGFCCPRYECPVSMATTVNVTTTTTTTTTTLPPHFPVHSYKGSAQKRGCLIKGHTYKVGEVVRASSGPCLHCTCGGDGQMKCDPKQCTPEPMLRQMIAAAVSAKRRR